MPTYEYRCQTCGEQFEKRAESGQEDETVKCPSCHSQDTRKKTTLLDHFFSMFNERDVSQENQCGGGEGHFT